MRELKTEKGQIWRFENYAEFIKTAIGPSEMEESRRASRKKDDDSFYGGTWEEAVIKGKSGDMQSAAILRKGMIKEANKIMGQVSRLDPVFKSDGGIWIDIGRYLSGEPEAWGDMVSLGEERHARQVSIVFNASVNCTVSAESYEKASRMIGGAVLGLKASGISVSLYLCYKNVGYKNTGITVIPMSNAGAFDIARLAATTKPWFFRRLFFSFEETRDASYRDSHSIYNGGGYGRSESMTLEDGKLVSGVKNPLVFNMEDLAYQSENDIREKVTQTLRGPEKVTI